MKIGSNNFNVFNKPQINKSVHISSLDTVSFSSKSENTKKRFPFRVESKFQDEFHITSKQIRVRNYLEFKNKGLSDEEIANAMFPSKNPPTEDETKEKINYIKNLAKEIEETDKSFEEIIPSLMQKTYYRGIVGNESNRAIKVVNEAKIGDIIQPDLGYPFLSSKQELAEEYSQFVGGESNPKNCVVMIIKTPKGTPISRDLSFNKIWGDKNVVLPRGVKYKVLNKEIKNEKTYITLEYLKNEK